MTPDPVSETTLSINYQSEDFRAGYLRGRQITRDNYSRRIVGVISTVACVGAFILFLYIGSEAREAFRDKKISFTAFTFASGFCLILGGFLFMGTIAGMGVSIGSHDKKDEIVIERGEV